MQEIKKIVVIGPESTGKSTLCSLLAQHFNTLWCAEYAREYLLLHGTDYTFETLEEIGKGQLALEESKLSAISSQSSVVSRQFTDDRFEMTEEINPFMHSTLSSVSSHPLSNHQPSTTNHQLLFIDTDMYVMKVWCEYVFGRCHPFILDEIVSRKYDLYLLCNTELPWVKDELREYPDEKVRLELFHIYKDILINQNVPWIEVKGDYDARLQTAIGAVNECCL